MVTGTGDKHHLVRRRTYSRPFLFYGVALTHSEDSTMTTIRFSFRNLAFAASGALLCLGTALAAGPGASADAQARYQQDMATCKSGNSNQDMATCRLEARNALAEAKRGGQSLAPGTIRQNAMRRCEVHQGDDRAACEARMMGYGSVEGSVSSGGVLRESVTVVPGK